MRLEKIVISGLRAYHKPTELTIDDLTILVGRNDAGKSTVFAALNLFLNTGVKPDATDFSVNSQEPISITCTFSDLPNVVVIDANAETTLQDEHLLDEEGNLQITKTWPRERGVMRISVRANHPTSNRYEPLIGMKHEQLKNLSRELGVDITDMDGRRNQVYRKAIWAALRDESVEQMITITLDKEDGKNVANAIFRYTPSFDLFSSDRTGAESDPVAQTPAKLVIRKVLDKHSESLRSIGEAVASDLDSMLLKVLAKFHEIQSDPDGGLRLAGTEPDWSKAFAAVRFEDESGVSLEKRGSGTRRLMLLSFFRAEAESEDCEFSEQYSRGMVIAIEEPETALHPDLQLQVLSALEDVAKRPDRQIIVTSHSPNLVMHATTESVRYIDDVNGCKTWIAATGDKGTSRLLESLERTMGFFSDHSVRCFILVEGRNDIEGLLNLSDALVQFNSDKWVSLRILDKSGVLRFIPIGGCGAAALWEHRLEPFRRSELYLVDSDKTSSVKMLSSEKQKLVMRINQLHRDDVAIYVLGRRELENYLTVEAIEHVYEENAGVLDRGVLSLAVAGMDWNYVDIPEVVAREVHLKAGGIPWSKVDIESRRSKISKVKKRLASAFSHRSVAEAVDSGSAPELVSMFEKVAESLRSKTGVGWVGS